MSKAKSTSWKKDSQKNSTPTSRPSDPNVIYVGTRESAIRGNASRGDGVFKSMDDGKTWTHVGLEDTRQIGQIRIDPANPELVYVAALHVKLNIFSFHQWTAYCTFLLTLSHPLVLLFLDKPHFRVFDILFPVQSPLQPPINPRQCTFLLVVFITSLLRSSIGRPL